MAETKGFEPSKRFNPLTPLAGERLRPLGHVSAAENVDFLPQMQGRNLVSIDFWGNSDVCWLDYRRSVSKLVVESGFARLHPVLPPFKSAANAPAFRSSATASS